MKYHPVSDKVRLSLDPDKKDQFIKDLLEHIRGLEAEKEQNQKQINLSQKELNYYIAENQNLRGAIKEAKTYIPLNSVPYEILDKVLEE